MKRLLLAAAAACALNSAARADDLTFTWSFTGTTLDTPHSLCGSDWVDCVPDAHDFSGTFTLTVPDDSHEYSSEVVKEDFGTETISFQTVGGQLLFYDLVDDFVNTSEPSYRHLYLTTIGGIESDFTSDPSGYLTSRTQITYGAGLPPNVPPPPVPEPGPASLLVAGLAVLAARGRRRWKMPPSAS